MKELEQRITENGIDYVLIGAYYYSDLKLNSVRKNLSSTCPALATYFLSMGVRINRTGR